MTIDPLSGFVVVLAGTDAEVGRALMRCGALLAVVSRDRVVVEDLERSAATQPTSVLLAFHADPRDAATWQRLSAQIEQRVGPVDAVICTEDTIEAVHATFDADMARRGHGAIVAVSPQDDAVTLLRQQLHRRP